jgi:hypothetical protein
MSDVTDNGAPRAMTSPAQFVRLVRRSRGAILSLRVPPPGGRLARLVLLSPDGDAAVAYIDRGPAAMACLLSAILEPPD